MKKRAHKFGKLLRKLRLEQGISQEELAHRSGVDRTYIGMLERAERDPSIHTLFAVAKGLKMKASSIVAKLEK